MVVKDGVGQYLQNIGRIPLLAADQEIVLGRAVKEWIDHPAPSPEIEVRGRRAKEKLMASNLRLVVHISKKYLNRGLEIEDLIQEGSIGLDRAVEKFDFTKGYKFSTYAYWWVRQAMTRAISDKSRLIRMPVPSWEKLNKLKSARREFMQDHGRPPSMQELSEIADFSLVMIENLMERFVKTNCMSLDQTVGKDGDTGLIDLISCDEQGTFDAIAQQNIQECLSRLVEALTDKEAMVIRLRFGMDDGESKTLREIGEKLGVSRERIRQLEVRALRKLRQHQDVKQFIGVA